MKQGPVNWGHGRKGVEGARVTVSCTMSEVVNILQELCSLLLKQIVTDEKQFSFTCCLRYTPLYNVLTPLPARRVPRIK